MVPVTTRRPTRRAHGASWGRTSVLLLTELARAAHEARGRDGHHAERDHARDEAREPHDGVRGQQLDVPRGDCGLVQRSRAEDDGEAALLAA